MDPLSISAAAAAFLKIFIDTIHYIKKTVETIKHAKEILIKLLAQTERVRLLLEQLRCLTKQLGKRASLALSYNDSEPRATMNEMHTLVKAIAAKKNLIAVQMLFHKKEVDRLLGKLQQHEKDFVTVLLTIATETSIRTEDEVRQMHKDSISQSKVITLFESDVGKSTQADLVDSVHVWFGDTSRSGFEPKYIELRDSMADFAWAGKWKDMFVVTQEGKAIYGQCWINAPRLARSDGLASGWNSLHQAAFLNASVKEVEAILRAGALRSLRTVWTDSSELLYKDMTALEIAQHNGNMALCEILMPVIRHHVPHRILNTLEERFHNLIRGCLDEREVLTLRLPDLSVLLELKIPEMWFPLKSSSPKIPRGYMYHLDGRELAVKEYGIFSESRMFRVTSQYVQEIEEAVVLGGLETGYNPV